jgi:hypothetical protein
MSKIIQLAKKLKALADRGEGGEKINAQKMLDDFLVKHKINIDEIEGEKKKRRCFNVKANQRVFFRQIVANVVGRVSKTMDGNRYYIDVSDSDYAEISLKFDFYWKLYQEELEIFYSAFIQANKLFLKETEEERGKRFKEKEDKKLSREEKERLLRSEMMQMGIKKDSPLKRIN